MSQLTKEQEKWQKDSIDEIQKLVDTFNLSNNGLAEFKDVDNMIKKDKNLQYLSKQQKFNPNVFIDQLKGVMPHGKSTEPANVSSGVVDGEHNARKIGRISEENAKTTNVKEPKIDVKPKPIQNILLI